MFHRSGSHLMGALNPTPRGSGPRRSKCSRRLAVAPRPVADLTKLATKSVAGSPGLITSQSMSMFNTYKDQREQVFKGSRNCLPSRIQNKASKSHIWIRCCSLVDEQFHLRPFRVFPAHGNFEFRTLEASREAVLCGAILPLQFRCTLFKGRES